MSSSSDTNHSRRPLALADLARLRTISDPQMSPDGQRIAFVVETILPDTNETRTQIWLAATDDSSEPRPLTAGDKQDSQPRWSPDGRLLAFVSTRSGSAQVWLLPLDAGEPRPITSHPTGAREPTWSPTGRHLAFLARGATRRGDVLPVESKDDRQRLVWVRQHRHKLDGHGFQGAAHIQVWTIGLDGSPPNQLTDGAEDALDPAWSPDGRQIAFVSDRSPDREWHFGGGAVHIVEVVSGQVRRLTAENGFAAHPAWSPDGRWIAAVGADDPDEAGPSNSRLWLHEVNGSTARCLTADLDLSVGQRPSGYLTPSAPAWLPDGTGLLYLIGDGPATHLVRVSESAREPLMTGRRVVQSFSVDRTGQRAALLVTDPTTPAEVWIWDAATGARPITALNQPLLNELKLAEPEDLRISRPDGMEVEGWLMRPTAQTTGSLPLILSIHGGPHNYFGDTFSFDHQLYAARGYAVLYGNPRGSGGYGEAFAQAVCRDWGGADYEDLLALVDATLARTDPPIDPKRLGITGGSYGGFMTCWAIGQTDRFAVAVSGACISNLISFFGTADIGGSWGVNEFGGTPFERLDWYLARSPLTYAPRVGTPLLLYHGEADLRCPIEQSEQMFTALRRLGKTVEFVRIPTESHGALSGTPTHRLNVRQAILDWFDRYLLVDQSTGLA